MTSAMRYREVGGRVVREIGRRHAAGVALLIVAPGEEPAVIAAVGAALPEATATPLEAADVKALEGVRLSAGLPSDEALVELNGLREWTRSRSALLIVALTLDDYPRFQRLAPDVAVAPAFSLEVAFEPRAELTLDEGRQALHRWYRERYGRIDLRGFLRREGEDVAWPMESLYQHARVLQRTPGHGARIDGGRQDLEVAVTTGRGMRATQTLAEVLSEERGRGTGLFVLLGHPGAGKSFFTRWCALEGSRAGSMLGGEGSRSASVFGGEVREGGEAGRGPTILRAAGSGDSEAPSVLGIEGAFPVLVPLAAYAAAPGTRTLLEFCRDLLLANAPAAGHTLGRAVAEGRALFLLDGLDEAGNEPSACAAGARCAIWSRR